MDGMGWDVRRSDFFLFLLLSFLCFFLRSNYQSKNAATSDDTTVTTAFLVSKAASLGGGLLSPGCSVGATVAEGSTGAADGSIDMSTAFSAVVGAGVSAVGLRVR